MKTSAFYLVTLPMVTDGASVVNKINSYKTVSPEDSVSGGFHKIRDFTLGRAFSLNKKFLLLKLFWE